MGMTTRKERLRRSVGVLTQELGTGPDDRADQSEADETAIVQERPSPADGGES